MVLRLAETENCIVEFIENLTELNTYTVRNFPGTPDQEGKVGMCEHVFVQFKNVNYQEPSNKFTNCANLLNTATFQIQILFWDLICHQEIYDAAQAIMENIQGKQLFKFDDEKPRRCSGIWIDKFEFKDVTDEEYYIFNILIKGEYPEIYQIEACK